MANTTLPTHDMYYPSGRLLMREGVKHTGLSGCAEFDFETGQKAKKTGWGHVSADRHERGISRKQRRLQRGK